MSEELNGELSSIRRLNGELSALGAMTGTMSGEGRLEGELTAVGLRNIEEYDGDYEVLPADGFQMLLTADKHLQDDIIVHPIPYAEVSNPSGGYTVTIGG